MLIFCISGSWCRLRRLSFSWFMENRRWCYLAHMQSNVWGPCCSCEAGNNQQQWYFCKAILGVKITVAFFQCWIEVGIVFCFVRLFIFWDNIFSVCIWTVYHLLTLVLFFSCWVIRNSMNSLYNHKVIFCCINECQLFFAFTSDSSYLLLYRCCFRCGVDKLNFNSKSLMSQASVACVQIHHACSEDVFHQMTRKSHPVFLDFLITLSVWYKLHDLQGKGCVSYADSWDLKWFQLSTAACTILLEMKSCVICWLLICFMSFLISWVLQHIVYLYTVLVSDVEVIIVKCLKCLFHSITLHQQLHCWLLLLLLLLLFFEIYFVWFAFTVACSPRL